MEEGEVRGCAVVYLFCGLGLKAFRFLLQI